MVVVPVPANYGTPTHAGQWIRLLLMTYRISSGRNTQVVRLRSFRVLFSFSVLSPRSSLVRVPSEFPPGFRVQSPGRFQLTRDARVFSCGFLVRRWSGMICCVYCMGNSPNYPPLPLHVFHVDPRFVSLCRPLLSNLHFLCTSSHALLSLGGFSNSSHNFSCKDIQHLLTDA